MRDRRLVMMFILASVLTDAARQLRGASQNVADTARGGTARITRAEDCCVMTSITSLTVPPRAGGWFNHGVALHGA